MIVSQSLFSFIPSLERFNYFICLAVRFTRIAIIQIVRGDPHYDIMSNDNIANETERVHFLKRAVNIARVLKFWIESDQLIEMNQPMHCWLDRLDKRIYLTFRGCFVQ